MKKVNSVKLANAVALSFAVIHVSFDLLSLVAPNTLKFIFNTWFHGFNLKVLVLEDTFAISLQQITIGLVSSVSTAWVIGYLIGYFYNRFSKES